MPLVRVLDWFLGLFNPFNGIKHWKLPYAIILSLFSLLLSYPKTGLVTYCMESTKASANVFSGEILNFNKDCVLLKAVELQIQHPFEKLDEAFFIDPNAGASHLKKRWCRITFPLVAYLFQLNYFGAILLSFIISILFILVLIQFTSNIWNRNDLSAMVGFSFISINPGIYGFHDFVYWDVTGYFLSSLLYLQKNPILSFIISILCLFSDERTIIPILFSVLYWGLIQNHWKLSIQSTSFRLFSISIFASMITQYVLKWQLSLFMGISYDYSGVGLWNYVQNMSIVPLAQFVNFEFFLFLFLLCIVLFVSEKKYVESIFLVLAFTILCSFLPFIIFDVSRSVNYAYPIVFIGIAIMYRYTFGIYALITTCLGCIIFPNYYFIYARNVPELWGPMGINKLMQFLEGI